VYYLNDTPASIAALLEANRSVIESGVDREKLLQMLPPGGARNALDCALWDLKAQLTGQPVWRLVGLDSVIPRITTFTLGADDPASVARAARGLTHARALKLKLTGELDADVERIRSVRSVRPEVWLGVDANQGYTIEGLEALLPTCLNARVELIEQPLPRGHEAELAAFDSPIPLAADESVQGLADVAQLVGRFDVVNIKLDKCGGLTEALLIVNESRRLGLKVMVGNMVGTSLAMAPAFIVAQLCDYVDLDGPTFIAHDRLPGVSYDGGSIHCPDEVWGGGIRRPATDAPLAAGQRVTNAGTQDRV
jgi:L-alanine-DL-glutamate epimerase-like enolase superfamily enzyme